MTRTKIQFKNAIGRVVTGYALLTDCDYIWCFNSKQDDYGYIISKTDIVKIYK